MKDKIEFIKRVLALTKNSTLNWVGFASNERSLHFVSIYKDSEISFHREILPLGDGYFVSYDLIYEGKKIHISKGSVSSHDKSETKLFESLEELGKLLAPDIVVPEIKIGFLDSVINKAFKLIGKMRK